MSKPLFPSTTARDIWMGRWCETCCEPREADKRLRGKGFGCILRLEALGGLKPKAWDRNARAATMDAAYTCNAFRDRPDVVRRATAVDETEPMFDVVHAPRNLIPIEGWPDYRAQQRKPPGDHA